MNFILDGMLGKLARWLRMMGHDVKYSNDIGDPDLLSIAKEEKRVLLTRDFALYQRAIANGLDTFYVEGTTEVERLSELAHRFNLQLNIDLENSHCPKCNTKLQSVPKKDIENKVEKNTLVHYDVFWRCLKCEAVYWQGGHWTKIRETLEKAKEKLKENERKVILRAT